MAEFRVLGPIEAVDRGRPVAVGAAKQRALLALLLLDPGRTARRDWLIDQLWDGDPPPAARSSLQAYVYRLRRLLAGTGAALRSGPGGYLLDAPAEAVDADRFERLIVEGRTAFDAGRPDEAARALRGGLDLWRGPAFAGVEAPAVRDRARHLELRRLEATELCLAADLDAGRADPVELEALIAAHPLRERLWELYLLTLYRAGRQAEALAAYLRLHRLLDDELGVEPAPSIRRLHQRMLAGDPALLVPPPAAQGGARVPRQLPAVTADFTGRAAPLAALDELLAPGPAAAVVSGTAGVGKTTLALHWAHRVAGEFTDGQLYLDLRGFDPAGPPASPAAAVRSLLDALGVPKERIPADPDAQTGLYRSLLSGKRILIVLDNARDAGQVRPLMPGGGPSRAVVTSRNRLAGLVAAEGARPVAVDLPAESEARAMLRLRIGEARIAAEPEAADDIVAACSRLPLALALVAARAAFHPEFRLAALAAELRGEHQRLDALVGDDPSADVRAVFSWSYQAVDPQAARMFRLLGLHPGPDASLTAAASLAGLPVRRARALLADLTAANLVAEHRPGRYALHDLLRAYATELAGAHDPDDERTAALRRVLDHHLHSGHAADRLLAPTRDDIALAPAAPGAAPDRPATYEQAMDWFQTEYRGLLAALELAERTGFEAHAWQLAWSLANFLDYRGYRDDMTAAWHTGVDAASRTGDPAVHALALRTLGYAYMQQRRFDDAHRHLEHALALCEAVGDHTARAQTHTTVSYVHHYQGRHAEALTQMRLAYEHFRIDAHLDGQAKALNGIGWCHSLLGDHRQALAHCESALLLHRKTGNRLGEAGTLDSIGYAHHHLGHSRASIDCYEQSVAIHREIGSRRHEADVLVHLGDAHAAAGADGAAEADRRAALAILEDLGHPDADRVRDLLS